MCPAEGPSDSLYSGDNSGSLIYMDFPHPDSGATSKSGKFDLPMSVMLLPL